MFANDINKIIASVDRYIAGGNDVNTPIIVDFQNANDLADFVAHYKVGNNKFISVSEYCCYDSSPKKDNLLNVLSNDCGVMFVLGLSSFLKLEGIKVLRNDLRDLLYMAISGRVIVLTFQCANHLNFSDPRLNTKIKILKSNHENIKPELIFTTPDLCYQYGSSVDGLNNLPKVLEGHEISESIFVNTNKTSLNFPDSYYTIRNLKKAYDILCRKDSIVYDLDESWGTDENWKYILKEMGERKLPEFIDIRFDNHKKLYSCFSDFCSFSENERWLFFIGLKLYGTGKDDYLDYVIKKTNKVDELIPNIYNSILDFKSNDCCFSKYYDSRKSLISKLPINNAIIEEFCKLLRGYNKKALYYLTDNTQKEKEFIIYLLDKYSVDFEPSELHSILKVVCPALANYLEPYKFNIQLLDKYFSLYNYQKMINKILPNFKKLVDEQAEKREFNNLLPARSSCLEKLEIEHSKVYFIDALGVEYLGFITSLCNNLKLHTRITVCHSELPSITSENKDFIDYFSSKGVTLVSDKSIDVIKHGGTLDYDYQQTKLPIHLIKELEIIDCLINKINSSLINEEFKKAIIISDHGASRLAVISESENIVSMSSRGEHSGRCCLKSDSDMQPENATDAGNYWSLANYDRFKGGRKACVEVHGGASLEEVCIPIIEITRPYISYTIRILSADADSLDNNLIPTILVSFRKKAAIKIFSTSDFEDVSIKIEGKSYNAEKIDDNFYRVEMPDIKRAKEYKLDVYSGSNKIAEDLSLIVKKESGSERNIL